MGEVLNQFLMNGLPTAAGALGYFRPLYGARLVGTVLTIGGVLGYLYPVALGQSFGIPFSDSNNALYFPAVGGRNAAAGITTLILSFQGSGEKRSEEYRKAMGILIACWSLAGFSDIAVLMATPGSENALVHARNICVLGIVSWRLLTKQETV